MYSLMCGFVVVVVVVDVVVDVVIDTAAQAIVEGMDR